MDGEILKRSIGEQAVNCVLCHSAQKLIISSSLRFIQAERFCFCSRASSLTLERDSKYVSDLHPLIIVVMPLLAMPPVITSATGSSTPSEEGFVSGSSADDSTYVDRLAVDFGAFNLNNTISNGLTFFEMTRQEPQPLQQQKQHQHSVQQQKCPSDSGSVVEAIPSVKRKKFFLQSREGMTRLGNAGRVSLKKIREVGRGEKDGDIGGQ
uniref:Uncharacterized protein n=1 Tax=Syphacia muris TaxID=451379 RepID=A0A0N5A9K2_9BILA